MFTLHDRKAAKSETPIKESLRSRQAIGHAMHDFPWAFLGSIIVSRMLHFGPMKAMRVAKLTPILTAVFFATMLGAGIAAEGETAKTADDPGDAVEKPAVPKVEELGEHRYRMGTIEFNGKTREIRVPTQMNLREGILEYALVHGQGKIHESLLVTEVPPSQLQIVLKLCNYSDGEGDVFDAFFPDDEKKGEAGAKERGEAVALTVEWDDGGERKAVPMSDWILDRKRDAALVDGPWIYSGSYFYGGDFMADTDGTLIAIYLSRGALLNTMTDGSDDDERWIANSDATPEIGTPVTLVLAPADLDGEAK